MPRNKNVGSINLSSNNGARLESVFFTWAITSGKLIIILTELIALGALGYRFWVDHQIIDLHDAIKRDQLLLKSQADKEKDYRDIQNRLTAIHTFNTTTTSRLQTMNDILDAVNTPNFDSPKFSLNGNTIHLDGIAQSIVVINSLISTLKSFPTITSINVDSLDSSDTGIKFNMIITIRS